MGADESVQLAGLCHAAYGTDGFDTALFTLEERDLLRSVAGHEAEAHVYFDGSATRSKVYAHLGRDEITHRDRFTGAEGEGTATQIAAFCELTAANELDVVRHNRAVAHQHGAALQRLVERTRPHLSAQAYDAWHATRLTTLLP